MKALPLLLALILATATQAAKPYTTYHALTPGAAGCSPEVEAGIERLEMVYEYHIWPGLSPFGYGDLNSQRHTFSEGHLRAYLRDRFPGKKPKLLCLDIEHWPLYWTADTKDGKVPPDVLAKRLDMLLGILRIVKEELPKTKVGYYAIVPDVKWANADGVNRNNWTWDRAMTAARLIDAVDVFFPEIYPYTKARTKEAFGRYAKATLDVCERIAGNRPIFAFIRPAVASKEAGKHEPMSLEELAWQIEVIESHPAADGFVAWCVNNRVFPLTAPLGESVVGLLGGGE